MRFAAFVRLACLPMLAVASNACGAFIEYQTPATAKCDGKCVDADVQITTSNNQITVFLNNLQCDPNSNWQNLYGVQFILSGGGHSGSLSCSSATDRTINQGGTWCDAKSSTTTGWSLSNTGGGFDLQSPGNSNNPHYSLIGAPNHSDNRYTNHSGVCLGSDAQFTISCPGVTSGTTVTGANFTFGGGVQIGGTSVVVPEPASLPLLSLMAIPFLARRRGAAQSR